MKVVAGLAFLLNTLLFGSYYSVAKEVLGHIDPIVFTFFTMMTLVPPGLCIVVCSWRSITRAAVKSGFLLGSCLCLGLFTLSIALKYNSATGTAFFPSLNGLLAALFTWLFLRQRITKATWFAGLISVVGAALLMLNASMGGMRGALIAFIGGLFCTCYIFLADREQKDAAAAWPLFGVELLTMALWANLIALLFGDWQFVHLELPKDGWVIFYIGIGTIFLPTLFTVLLQKYISPVTVSFIYILEPILGAVVAYLYLHELLPLDGYLGGGLIVGGVLINTWATVEQPLRKLVLPASLSVTGQRLQASLIGTLIYPVMCCGIGVFIVYKIGGFPPAVWHDFYAMGPQIPSLLQHGQSLDVLLLTAQSLSWLIAWSSLIVMGCLTSYRAVKRLCAFVPTTLEPINIDVRTLRQMGYTPSAVAAGKRRENQQRVQRRRQQRRERLARGGARLQTFSTEDGHWTRAEEYFKSWAETDTIAPVEVSSLAVAGRDGSLKSSKVRLVAVADAVPAARSGSFHVITAREQSESVGHDHYNDAFGNHWAYWDDLGRMETGEL